MTSKGETWSHGTNLAALEHGVWNPEKETESVISRHLGTDNHGTLPWQFCIFTMN